MGSHQKFTVDPGWKLIMKDLQISSRELLVKSELPVDLFEKKDPSLSPQEYYRFWTQLEGMLQDQDIPLVLGQAFKAEAFSPLLMASFSSPNANVCFERLSKFKKLVGPLELLVEQGESTTTVELRVLPFDAPIPRLMVATDFVFLVHLVRMATREEIKPLKVITKLGLPESTYTEYFGQKVEKGEVDRLVFRSRDTQIPFLTENTQLWSFYEPQLQEKLAELERDVRFQGKVQSLLIDMLPSGLCSAEDVARRLHISKRTLQRNLKSEGTSFQQILGESRELMARSYLRTSELTSSQISFLLGYDDPGSFTRAFHGWTGTTPEALRQSL